MTRARQVAPWPAVDLVAELSLPVGASFFIQNVSGNAGAVRYFEGAAAPPDPTIGHLLFSGSSVSYTVSETGEGLWVWGEISPQALMVTDQI